MQHDVLVLLGAAALSTFAACSSNATAEGGPDSARGVCATSVPSTLSVSEGGLVTFPASEGVTYEASGGATVTAHGTSVSLRAPYRATAEGDVVVKSSCGATVPVELRPLTWTRLAEWTEGDGANAREYGAWWIDPAGPGALVVFGGFHYFPEQFTPANDAWRFDFATSKWSPLTGTALPTLPGGRAAPIPGERAVLYFGGASKKANGSLDTSPSLYRLDYDDVQVTATKKDNLGSVPGSYTGSFLYDAKRRRWLSVCGLDSTTGLYCDVDAYTEERGFEHLAPAGKAPTGRNGFHYAYDEATDRVILFGGQIGPENLEIDGETWALELGTEPPEWTQLFADGAGPTKRRNGAFALDTVGHRLFVWGGTPNGRSSVAGLQVLSLDRGREAWASVETPADVRPRTSALGALDQARDRILFGFGNGPAALHDLWSLDVANVNPR